MVKLTSFEISEIARRWHGTFAQEDIAKLIVHNSIIESELDTAKTLIARVSRQNNITEIKKLRVLAKKFFDKFRAEYRFYVQKSRHVEVLITPPGEPESAPLN